MGERTEGGVTVLRKGAGSALAATVLLAIAACTAESAPEAQADLDPEAPAVLAVADAALEAISAEDWEALADLMIDGAISVSTSTASVDLITRDAWLARPPGGDIVERGFDPEIRVSGTIASVWYPYDFYLDGAWSHCGVDVFTLAYTGEAGWRIASLAWSREQPPACREHPDGPP
ncbi:MAG TPA: hypothetical protein VJ925_13710 [Longimicrobiales bacterium]|nr:hypothetical protein [Longimicrobiales bacterium]